MSDANPFRHAKRHPGNLRGAPLFIRPSVVRALCENVDAIARAVVQVPISPVKLVDRPRRSEDPRLAQANDDGLLPPPGEKIRSGEDGARGAVSGSLPVPEAAPQSNSVARTIPPEIVAIEPGRVAPPEKPSAPVLQCNQAEKAEPEDWPDAPLPGVADPDLDRPEPAPLMRNLARKRDTMHRQRANADARALEAPVDRQVLDDRAEVADRREQLREAARRLAERQLEKRQAELRISIGAPTPRAPSPTPALMPEVRRARLVAATAFLKTHAILVSVADRDAAVRRYRISGRRDAVFAEEVIELAQAMGMELPGVNA